MTKQTTQSRSRLSRFLGDEDANVSVEAILLVPLLFWAFVGIYTLFDAYKKQIDGLRANYAVADAISREENVITSAYLDSMHKLTNYMTRSPRRVTQRYTIVCRDADNETLYTRAWSAVRGPDQASVQPLTSSDLNSQGFREKLPEMPVGDQVILLETFMDFQPLISLGVEERTFDFFTVTRPRFTNQIKYENQPTWVC